MLLKLTVFIFVFVFSVLSIIGNLKPSHENDKDIDQGRMEHRVIVKLIDDEWRVVLADNESESDVVARRGDRVRWDVEGSDVTFKFKKKGIFGIGTRKVKDGNQLILPILDNSPLGVFEYSVFIENSGTYARGQSPPRIIVR